MQAVRPQFDQSNWNYRPSAVVEQVDLAAPKRPLMGNCMNSSGDITRCVVPSRHGAVRVVVARVQIAMRVRTVGRALERGGKVGSPR
jgi:hypothetical protein